MTREELKSLIEELMRQYSDEEIDGATYFSRMMELITSAQEELDEDQKRSLRFRKRGKKMIIYSMHLKMQQVKDLYWDKTNHQLNWWL